jgi:hypothetical protein
MARKDDDRTLRLAAALRENLKRRKAQARAAAEELKEERHPGEGRDLGS